jgi:hypothetical protein
MLALLLLALTMWAAELDVISVVMPGKNYVAVWQPHKRFAQKTMEGRD